MRTVILNILLSILLLSCKNDLEVAKLFGNPEDVQVEISEDIRLIHSEKGVTDAIITARIMHRLTINENKTTFPEGLQIELFEEGTPTAIIQAGFGERDEHNRQLKMTGGVSMINNKQERMDAENLLWNERTATITIEGKVKVTTPTDIIEGYGLESDDKFQNYKLSRITGIVNVEDDNVP